MAESPLRGSEEVPLRDTGSAPLAFSGTESGRRTTTSAARPAALSEQAVKTATQKDLGATSAKGLYTKEQMAAQSRWSWCLARRWTSP